MLIAALDTGMRQGEMLALRFRDVDLPRGLITLRGHTTKSGKSRVVPISTERLRDGLAWLRVDAEGQQKPDEALVFSNEVGEPLRLFHRTWQTLVLRAHGHTATWAARLNYQGLSDESQDAFRTINLRWHDLRHEYASRLVEQGATNLKEAVVDPLTRSASPARVRLQLTGLDKDVRGGCAAEGSGVIVAAFLVTRAISPSAAVTVRQQTAGDMSPAIAGVAGNVEIVQGSEGREDVPHKPKEAVLPIGRQPLQWATNPALHGLFIEQSTRGHGSPAVANIGGNVTVELRGRAAPRSPRPTPR